MIDEPSDRVGYLLWQTAHLVHRELTTALAAWALTPAQFGALVHIAREPGLSAAEVARRVNLTPQSIQTALHPLLTRQLLERRRHPVHKRVLGLFLTEQGGQLIEEANAAVTMADQRTLTGFSPSEADTFRSLLRRAMLTLSPTALDRSSVRSRPDLSS